MHLIQLMKKWFGKEEEEEEYTPVYTPPTIPEGTTRIVHNVQVNGKEEFIPEVYKHYWAMTHTAGVYTPIDKYNICHTVEEAQKVIDNYIAQEQELTRIQYENSIKYTEHLQYP